MKSFGKILLILLIIVVLLCSSAFLFLKVYEKDIKAAAISVINKQINAEIQYKDYYVSIFSSFPYASLVFEDLKIITNKPFENLELAYFNRLYLNFHLLKLLKKRFVVTHLGFSNGQIHLLRNKNALVNYDILISKKDSNADTSKSMAFDISHIKLLGIQFWYQDEIEKIDFNAKCDRLDMKLHNNDEQKDIKVKAKAFINAFSIKDQSIYDGGAINIQTKIKYETANSVLNIDALDCSLDFAEISGKGSIQLENNTPGQLNLEIQLSRLDIKESIALLPSSLAGNIRDFEVEGSMDMQGKIQGKFSSESSPSVQAEFHIDKGSAHLPKNVMIHKIKCSGSFAKTENEDWKKFHLILEKYSFQYKENKINGEMNIAFQDITTMQGSIETKLNLEGTENLDIFGERDKFKIKADVNLNYLLVFDDPKSLDPEKSSVTGKINIRNMEAFSDSLNYGYQIKNAEFLLEQTRVEVKNVQGKYNSFDFNLNGHMDNLMKYIFGTKEKLLLEARLESSHMNIRDFFFSSTDDNSLELAPAIPENIHFLLHMNCKKIQYNTFSAENFSGKINMQQGEIELDNIEFNTFKGKMNLNGKIRKNKADELVSEGIVKLYRIDINQLFKDLGNFQQTFLTDQNIKGTMDSKIEIRSHWDQKMHLVEDKLFMLADIRIHDGELINFEPLMNLFLFLKMKKMQHLQFNTIENSILINNRNIIIPKMKLNSNAFDMDISGTHSFDNLINYHFKVNLSELFFGKNEKPADEFEGEDDGKGGINLFIIMDGLASEPSYRIDKAAIKEQIKEGIKKESNEFKDLFKSKDKKKSKQEDDFDWEWDE